MNEYSTEWFELFLNCGDPPHTTREVEYLSKVLPLPEYRRLIDLCCGTGRHARALAPAGYDVTGVDRDMQALLRARKHDIPGTAFIQADMQDLSSLNGTWDAAVIMWASFGYFDREANLGVLQNIRSLIRPAGRIVLDLYNRQYFEHHSGDRLLTILGREVREVRTLTEERLNVRLEYGSGGGGDHFSWEVYDPPGVASLAKECDLDVVHVCSGFDESAPPTRSLPRMQVLLSR